MDNQDNEGKRSRPKAPRKAPAASAFAPSGQVQRSPPTRRTTRSMSRGALVDPVKTAPTIAPKDLLSEESDHPTEVPPELVIPSGEKDTSSQPPFDHDIPDPAPSVSMGFPGDPAPVPGFSATRSSRVGLGFRHNYLRPTDDLAGRVPPVTDPTSKSPTWLDDMFTDTPHKRKDMRSLVQTQVQAFHEPLATWFKACMEELPPTMLPTDFYSMPQQLLAGLASGFYMAFYDNHRLKIREHTDKNKFREHFIQERKERNEAANAAQQWKDRYAALQTKLTTVQNELHLAQRDALYKTEQAQADIPASYPPVPPFNPATEYATVTPPVSILRRGDPAAATRLPDFGHMSYNSPEFTTKDDPFIVVNGEAIVIPPGLQEIKNLLDLMPQFANSEDRNAPKPRLFKQGTKALHEFISSMYSYWAANGQNFQHPLQRVQSLFSFTSGEARDVLAGGATKFSCQYKTEMECFLALWDIWGDLNPYATNEEALTNLTYPRVPEDAKTDKEAWATFKVQFCQFVANLGIPYPSRGIKLMAKLPHRHTQNLTLLKPSPTNQAQFSKLLADITQYMATYDSTQLSTWLARVANRNRQGLNTASTFTSSADVKTPTSSAPRTMGRPKPDDASKKPRAKSTPDDGKTCFTCGGVGHMARDCPVNKKPDGSKDPTTAQRQISTYPDQDFDDESVDEYDSGDEVSGDSSEN
ncbi:uncharacterized protein ALTATR162_LOCUS11701 [Alternaria atra]|uniref:CCHC-type domain-containing protein n=1 Tax=Alternaria atra TaxID=119953 RepID=A0A8J2IBN7_9PLEO|nr:uncharacterized protein ALTATR162_LOCUS5070 [Alternaria atra]XP_043175278.1 uncharacterized protein ALTATR162_LOCUS11701 [Alternaria atra]CAG5158420.1 unnamed protein product [Alternaria atra]CAG5187371.1 unnamed protein product [Alternaria atra]